MHVWDTGTGLLARRSTAVRRQGTGPTVPPRASRNATRQQPSPFSLHSRQHTYTPERLRARFTGRTPPPQQHPPAVSPCFFPYDAHGRDREREHMRHPSSQRHAPYTSTARRSPSDPPRARTTRRCTSRPWQGTLGAVRRRFFCRMQFFTRVLFDHQIRRQASPDS